MASAPLFKNRAGDYVQSIVLNTNLDNYTLVGTVSEGTVDVQVSINGGAYVSSPSLISLSGTDFTLPNPDAYQSGYPLDLGVTTLQVRSIDMLGGVSTSSSAEITRVDDLSDVESLIPTGIKLARSRTSVTLLVAKEDLTSTLGVGDNYDQLEFRGFNFYVSDTPGATSGRLSLNTVPLSEVTDYEETVVDLTSNQTDFLANGVTLRTRVTQEDSFGVETEVVLDKSVDIFDYNRGFRFSSTVGDVQKTEQVSFEHDRSGSGLNLYPDVDISEPLYYTVTGVYYDSTQGLEFETPHSQEVVGSPLTIDTNLKDLPSRSAQKISEDYIRAIQAVNATLSLVPGSITRDVDIDPFASEAERLWFVLDFVHRSQSLLTLLQLDDANRDTISDVVASSPYKQALKSALGLSTDTAVQTLIDTQFEKLAGNFNIQRLSGRPATGQVVFFTTTRPTVDLVVSAGAVVSTDSDTSSGLTSLRFVVGGSYTLPAADADAYYNYDNQRYEVIADVVAEALGSVGNRPAGQIKNIVSGVSRLQVVNTEATTFGSDRESNYDLALRAQLGLVSVDTGTLGGYNATAAGQVGIIKSKVVMAGDTLMMRDWDPIRAKHIGGKVDIWVQGLRERTVSETFSFSFSIANDVRCQAVDLTTLTFQVQDSRVTSSTPITEILNDPTKGYGVRNTTTGEDYDLVGYTLVSYNTFRLDTSRTQPVTALGDVITADYRFKSINQFKFKLQPVRRVASVVGEVSGSLSSTEGYTLYKTEDPLLEGESTLAGDYMTVNQVGGIPAGTAIGVTNESHTLIGFFEEPLRSVGANLTTIRVFSSDRTIEYAGPTSSDPDYGLVGGSTTTPLRLVRTQGSSIESGAIVVVDYSHDENFTVTYVVNDLLQQLQRAIDLKRHTTADVVVKQAIQNQVALDTVVQLNSGASRSSADPAIRTNTSIELNSKTIGQGIAQSDLINAIDSTEGVDFQVLPLAKMGYSDGARKLRESVLNASIRLPSLDLGSNQAFLLTSALQYPTTDGGGLATEHRGIFQDDVAMVLSSDLGTVCLYPGQAFIVGSGGAEIAGYSDDATLISQGYTTSTGILAERLSRTANKVVLSLTVTGSPTDNPDLHLYHVSYVVRGDLGPHDISVSDVEYLTQGELTITAREVS